MGEISGVDEEVRGSMGGTELSEREKKRSKCKVR